MSRGVSSTASSCRRRPISRKMRRTRPNRRVRSSRRFSRSLTRARACFSTHMKIARRSGCPRMRLAQTRTGAIAKRPRLSIQAWSGRRRRRRLTRQRPDCPQQRQRLVEQGRRLELQLVGGTFAEAIRDRRGTRRRTPGARRPRRRPPRPTRSSTAPSVPDRARPAPPAASSAPPVRRSPGRPAHRRDRFAGSLRCRRTSGHTRCVAGRRRSSRRSR